MKTKSLLKHVYSMYGYRKSEEIELSPRKLIKRDIRSIAVGGIVLILMLCASLEVL